MLWPCYETSVIYKHLTEFSTLQEGHYEYKYIVDGEWTCNKHEFVTSPNKDGHVNNYVQVSSSGKNFCSNMRSYYNNKNFNDLINEKMDWENFISVVYTNYVVMVYAINNAIVIVGLADCDRDCYPYPHKRGWFCVCFDLSRLSKTKYQLNLSTYFELENVMFSERCSLFCLGWEWWPK